MNWQVLDPTNPTNTADLRRSRSVPELVCTFQMIRDTALIKNYNAYLRVTPKGQLLRPAYDVAGVLGVTPGGG